MILRYFRSTRMKRCSTPNYISSKAWFDGTNYSLIELGETCTVSSYLRVLTNEWSAHTISRKLGWRGEPVGRIAQISIGAYAFVGNGCVIIAGSSIGRSTVVGAEATVRGRVDDYQIAVYGPMRAIGDSREHLRRHSTALWMQIRQQVPSRADSGC